MIHPSYILPSKFNFRLIFFIILIILLLFLVLVLVWPIGPYTVCGQSAPIRGVAPLLVSVLGAWLEPALSAQGKLPIALYPFPVTRSALA